MNHVLEIALALLLATGSFFAFLGAFALLKLRSFLRRLHGPTKASTLGVGCILIASIVFHIFYGTGLHPRELLIMVFLFLTAPVSAHMMSRATLSLMGELPPDSSRLPDPDGKIREDADNRNA
ncbi:MAG: Na+/H+ antiporter subunit G [Luteimonas sp.]